MPDKPPYICEPTDQSQGRPATFIFLHGYADEAEGLPLGLAQQFQFNHKLPHLRWVLPNAPRHPEAREQAWYMPKALPNAMKPRVPGHGEDEATGSGGNDDDEEGIMKTVDTVDELVRNEITRGVPGDRIVVGGFSQGCAISLVWGLTGRMRDQVAGVVGASGYFPLADRIGSLREERKVDRDTGSSTTTENQKSKNKKWLYQHGGRDILVPKRLFAQGQTELKKWIDEADLEAHLYEGMGHSTCNAELRDLLFFLEKVVPP